MTTYAVKVHFHGSTVITVEADDPDQAEDLAAELWENGEEGEHDGSDWDWQRTTVEVAPDGARLSGLSPSQIEELRQAEAKYRAEQAAS